MIGYFSTVEEVHEVEGSSEVRLLDGNPLDILNDERPTGPNITVLFGTLYGTEMVGRAWNEAERRARPEKLCSIPISIVSELEMAEHKAKGRTQTGRI